MYERNIYIGKIMPFMGKPVIKVITGMRRTGKSYLLRLLIEQLKLQRVASKRIVYIDKESYTFDSIRDYHDLSSFVEAQLPENISKNEKCYIFIDEVQEIVGWEKIVASWSSRQELDVVITGSNAKMLSGELATLLAGRYVECPVYPLSLKEFIEFHHLQKLELEQVFKLFLKYGGMPGLHTMGELDESTFLPFASGIYDTVVLRDVVQRQQIRNHVLLDRVVRYIFDNIGNLTNASRISAFLKNQRISVGVDTILNYMSWLSDAWLTHRVQIYDIKGKRHLEVNEKHYVNDLGLRNALIGDRPADISGTLENVVLLELLRRGYKVCVGRAGLNEIDFVAERAGRKQYYQVSYLLLSKVTIEREVAPLLALSDNYPKMLLTLDRSLGDDIDGVQRIYLPEWLLQE